MVAIESAIELPIAALAEVAVEWWRLERWAGGGDETRLVARHVARRLERFLTGVDIRVLDPIGQPYDAGLALEVLDSAEDLSLPAGSTVVNETVAPIVLRKGTVVRHGQVVLRRGVT
jgi:hypothetical protein